MIAATNDRVIRVKLSTTLAAASVVVGAAVESVEPTVDVVVSSWNEKTTAS